MEETKPVDLDVVIVNWNAGTQLRECLQSLEHADGPRCRLQRVVVVDNASTDDSLNDLPAGLPLVVIRNATNRGFGAACNQGAQGSRADLLLFLNPDARLDGDALAVAATFMARPDASDVGVCGVQLVDESGKVARSCARMPRSRQMLSHAVGIDRIAPALGFAMLDWDHTESRDVDHVIGAFYLIRRRLFEELAGFDERFFVYLEDLDLSARVRAAGYRVRYLADVRAFHKGGGTSEQVRAARLFYSLQSRLLFVWKHQGTGSALAASVSTLLVEPGIRAAHALAVGSVRDVGEVGRAYLRLWSSLPRTAGLAWSLRWRGGPPGALPGDGRGGRLGAPLRSDAE